MKFLPYSHLLAVPLLIAIGFASRAWTQETNVALLPLSTLAAPASTVQIDVLVVNRSAVDEIFPLGEQLTATMSAGGDTWPVTLRAEKSPGEASRIPAGGIVARRYVLTMPAEARGRALLELVGPWGMARSVIDIAAPASTSIGAPSGVDAFDRLRPFGKRFTADEPMYLIAGPQVPRAKNA